MAEPNENSTAEHTTSIQEDTITRQPLPTEPKTLGIGNEKSSNNWFSWCTKPIEQVPDESAQEENETPKPRKPTIRDDCYACCECLQCIFCCLSFCPNY